MAQDGRQGASLTLNGEACVLRAWRRGDIAALVRHANNIKVARQLRDRFPHPYTRAAAAAFMAHAGAVDPPTNFAIVVEGEAAGGIGYVRGGDIERYSAEVGYWLGETHWGKGIVTDALRLLTGYAFTEVKLLRLFAVPLVENVASIRVLEKAGYEREGLLRASCVKHGEKHDQWMYARINTPWSGPVP